VWNDPAQRLLHDILGFDRRPEELAGETGDRLTAFTLRSRAHHCGAGTDTDQLGVAAALPHAPDQQRHVSPLPPTIGMQLIHDEKAQG